MNNALVAQIFRDIAKILEIKGDNPFRIRAYQRAAQNVEALAEDVEHLVKEDKLGFIPGVGEDLANKIKEIVQTGGLKFLADLEKSVPQGLLELLNIPSVGPKTARLLYEKLKISSIAGLKKAIEQNKLTGLFGIKEKTVENILRGIEIIKKGKERMPLASAILVADEFVENLKKLNFVEQISVAGSLRRRKDTVRDIDILVISRHPDKVMDKFTHLPAVENIIAEGETKSSIVTKDKTQVDLRVLELKSFGAALLYFTGSKDFNIKLRQLAIKNGLKVSEYGVFRKGKYIAGKTEEEIFKLLGLSYIVPELREDRGEIELARQGKLPVLIELKDIKGDLHTHSTWSDGGNSILEMAAAAKKKGYAYIALTDHSQSLKVAGGLSTRELKNKKAEIDKINKSLKGIRVLYGAEVEIDSSGNLDYKDEVLKEFDVAVAAVHSGFKQSKEQLTKRVIKACKNKYCHIIAHPTGRLWGTREPYELDFEQVFKVAKDTNTHLEINSFTNRLDLNDINAHRAKELGVKLAINTDSHTTGQLAAMGLGISVARRGWLSKEDVINTLPLVGLLRALKK